LLFIGEAPGSSEDICGLPFVGRSGELLDALIEKAFPSHVPSLAITNVIACAPWETKEHSLAQRKVRQPSENEAAACSSRLSEFIDAAQPKGVVLL
jgi:DNA polymerase